MSRSNENKALEPMVLKLHRDGKSMGSIARTLRMPKSSIQRILERALRAVEAGNANFWDMVRLPVPEDLSSEEIRVLGGRAEYDRLYDLAVDARNASGDPWKFQGEHSEDEERHYECVSRIRQVLDVKQQLNDWKPGNDW